LGKKPSKTRFLVGTEKSTLGSVENGRKRRTNKREREKGSSVTRGGKI